MSDLSAIFGEGAKVVISPDKMRAWVSLPPPAKGVRYTEAAIAEWLPQHGVVYGADDGMIHKAVTAGRYDDLLEVARGKQPVAAQGGDYVLKVEKHPFTGLRAGADGGLIYEDLSFLQEVQAGQVLAEIVPGAPAEDGMTVTGEPVSPREGGAGRTLQGSGFVLSEDGRSAIAPVLGHVNIVNEQLIVTPLTKLERLTAEDGEVHCEGNVLVEGDILAGSKLSATGSIFVAGRAVAATFKAGNNLLLCNGLRAGEGFGSLEAKENVWGLCFESCAIKAGGDICANTLTGCEVTAGGRASILGGRSMISSTTLRAKGGVVTGHLGTERQDVTTILAGLDRETMDRYEALNKRIERMTLDIQATMQNIAAHERVNSRKEDKGRNDPAYKEMVKKRDQSLSVLNIITNERTRLKRTIDSFSSVSVVVRDVAFPGVTISIDTRTLNIMEPLRRVKFTRNQETIEFVSAAK